MNCESVTLGHCRQAAFSRPRHSIPLYGPPSRPMTYKAHLHDIHFGHGTSKFWHAGQLYRVRPTLFLPCKSKFFGPRAGNFTRAGTTSVGSLGPPKKRSAYQNWAFLDYASIFLGIFGENKHFFFCFFLEKNCWHFLSFFMTVIQISAFRRMNNPKVSQF